MRIHDDLGANLLKVICLAVLLTIISYTILAGNAKANVDAAIEKVDEAYTFGEFDRGIHIVQSELRRDDLTDRDRVTLYVWLSMLHYAKGIEHLNESVGYLEKIIDIDPCLLDLPEDDWQQGLRDAWYGLLIENKLPVTCEQEDEDTSAKTIAVMEFENLSAAGQQEQLGYLTKGMAELFELHFHRYSGLRIVERDKIDFLVKEHQLASRGLSEALTMGRIVGAKIMVFGSVILPRSGPGEMIVKAVDVETSDILTHARIQGEARDFFHDQESLARELALGLKLQLSTATDDESEELGTSSEKAAELYAKGIDRESRYEYSEALSFFKRACEEDPTFAAAKRKVDIYRLHADQE
ncbi:MAG: hypothetical protein JW819_08690 [Candidatus Krumholzibacteriota bacterium]|nr:hypothetical protein [Candidatus Krumholzibacteriota bacterium]